VIVRTVSAIAFSIALTQITIAEANPICGMKYVSPSQVEKVLKRQKKLSPNAIDPLYTSYLDQSSRTEIVLWAFTRSGNPSHPSVICRKMTLESKGWMMRMDARCGGPKAACDKMVSDFSELNRKISQEFQKKPN
jgi:hypothetical protein